MKDHEVAIMNEAIRLIEVERDRQISSEGYSAAHDDEHTDGQLALLAAVYALSSCDHGGKLRQEIAETLEFYNWPFKPANPIRDLVRAGALILAEIERRLRREVLIRTELTRVNKLEGERMEKFLDTEAMKGVSI